MKPPMSSPSIISFVFVLFFAVSAARTIVSNVNTHYRAVKDTDGNEIVPGQQYFIEPAKNGNGGGVCPAPRVYDIFQLCTLDVVLANSPAQRGQPVSFELVEGTAISAGFINIKFESVPFWNSCFGTKYWRIVKAKEFTKPVVSVNGDPGTPDSKFAILEVKDEKAYKLVHCANPSVKCQDIGFTVSDDLFKTSHLVVSDGNPLLVKFTKFIPQDLSAADENNPIIKLFSN